MNKAMNITKRAASRAMGVVALAVLALASGNAHAIKVGGEWMTSWSGCEVSAGGLSYTDDQISLWLGKMTSLGHSQSFNYGNGNVWASDMSEDSLGGQDNLYADNVDFFALSSHGAAGPNNAYFTSPTCKSGTMTSGQGGAWFRSTNSRWDDTGSLGIGWGRFLMLFTCFSVDVNPAATWGVPLDWDGDIVMGYRGLSADSSTTDEVGEDLGEAVFNDGDTFKAGWFWAIEDWWVDDVGELVSTGSNQTECNSRLNNLTPAWGRRLHTFHSWRCWSWHEG